MRAAGIEFHRFGMEDYPLGTLQKLDEQLAAVKGDSQLFDSHWSE